MYANWKFGLRRQAERDAALAGGGGKALSPLRSASAVQKLLPMLRFILRELVLKTRLNDLQTK
jgi:hypothetical protein